jgi:hypothetical protein
MIEQLTIKSDFQDSYDYLQQLGENVVVYKRMYSASVGRGVELHWLKQRSVNVVELKAVSQFSAHTQKLVVYKNPLKHQFQGKTVMDRDEAMEMYPNALASHFYSECSYKTYKYLQIGKRRWQLELEAFGEELREGKMIGYTELEPGYNNAFSTPIFSVDYLLVGEEYVAIDCNNIQKISHLGIESLISAEEVIKEIREAILYYGAMRK